MSKIHINNQIYSLYRKSRLDINVSLEWILGYVYTDYCTMIKELPFIFNLDSGIECNIDEAVIVRISKEFSGLDITQMINILLWLAFILGGGE